MLTGSCVRIVSVWWDECALMCLIAEARSGTARTERVGERCSVWYVSGVEGETREECAERADGGIAERVEESQMRWMEEERRAAEREGQRVGRREEWTTSVSSALQAAI